MSDQGERGVRWTDMSESEPRDESGQAPGAGGATGPQVAFPEPKVPEEFMPAPAGPADPADFGADAPSHDVWGKVEETPAPAEPPAPEAAPAPAKPPSQSSGDRAADDVKVAPVPEDEAPQWEGSLFDEGADDSDGPGSNYVPAVPTGSGQPAKPGKPSSGNWQMPDWMADEESADAKLGGSPKPPRDRRDRRDRRDGDGGLDGDGGRSRLMLFGGVGLLVVALIAAGAVFFVKGGGDDGSSTPSGTADKRAAAEESQAAQVKPPPDKALAKFRGTPSRMLGMVTDAHSGLAYPRLAAPWQVPTKKNKLGTAGWSGQQILVTERLPQQLWYGQLLTGTLHPSLVSAYDGPESVQNVAALVAQSQEAQYYAFPHKSAPLASQALTVDGHRGWLVASYLTYRRDGVRATGEVVATAVIDTGRKTPAVVFASMPNTHKQRWPDVNEFLAHLKIAS
ncbi:hypothetical protein [Actinomadura sp. GTD37]|uniref:hypothetical protein n=1 Tax=Actinomadura sp. GTD37 TaxID=1778030 RepID=UPI0035BF17D1